MRLKMSLVKDPATIVCPIEAPFLPRFWELTCRWYKYSSDVNLFAMNIQLHAGNEISLYCPDWISFSWNFLRSHHAQVYFTREVHTYITSVYKHFIEVVSGRVYPRGRREQSELSHFRGFPPQGFPWFSASSHSQILYLSFVDVILSIRSQLIQFVQIQSCLKINTSFTHL